MSCGINTGVPLAWRGRSLVAPRRGDRDRERRPLDRRRGIELLAQTLRFNLAPLLVELAQALQFLDISLDAPR